ncbi:hypothetical protein MKW94_024267, partial [Papaver nudicaule]|nr:hypothetical protein [Papaver nudicaule]
MFVHPPPRDDISIRSEVLSDFSSTSPQQVEYGIREGTYNLSVIGSSYSYKYLIYQSGEIHNVVIGLLIPYTTIIVGDLGQAGWTATTLNHIARLLWDLSYAGYYQPRWDSFGQIVEPLASQRTWMVTQGNHEIEYIPIFYPGSFATYNARWHMLKPVDRNRTPWLIVIVHTPWYTTNIDHQLEYASVGIKNAMEELIYEARVDAVFAGQQVWSGHITIGDGGNREGLSD